jgi:hypothetical protein
MSYLLILCMFSAVLWAENTIVIMPEYKTAKITAGTLAVTIPRDRPDIYMGLQYDANNAPYPSNDGQRVFQDFQNTVPRIIQEKCAITKAGFEDVANSTSWAKHSLVIRHKVRAQRSGRNEEVVTRIKKENLEIDLPDDSTIFEFPTLFNPEFVLILQHLSILATAKSGTSVKIFTSSFDPPPTFTPPPIEITCSSFFVLWDNKAGRMMAQGFAEANKIVTEAASVSKFEMTGMFEEYLTQIFESTCLYKR